MSSVLVDGLFELRKMLKVEDIDQATSKLRQLIIEADGDAANQTAESDPLAEQIRNWLCLFLDEEHAVELARIDKSRIDVQKLARHVEEQHKITAEGLHTMPALATIIHLCALLGYTSEAQGLSDGVKDLQHHLNHHLIMDEKLRLEVSSLGQFLADSLGQLEEITNHMGDEDSELNQARQILSTQLPDDPEAAFTQLRQACNFLTSAENKLDGAVETVAKQMESSIQEVAQLRSHLKEARKEARQDPLTGLANRRELKAYFNDLDDQAASLLVLDLDHFKKINDSYGHDVGDEVLAEIGKRLAKSVREDDIVARVGGEEFVTVLKGVKGRAVSDIAEQIRHTVAAHPIKTAAGDISVTASVGVATRNKSENIEGWMKRADQALYVAKKEGRNRTRLATD